MSDLAAQISALSLQIAKFGADQEDYLDRGDQVLDTVVDETNRMNVALNSFKSTNIIYVNANNGDDTRSVASTPALAVKTLNRALSLCRALEPNSIRLLTDVTLNEQTTFNTIIPILTIQSFDGTQQASARRTITISDNIEGQSQPGRLFLSGGSITLSLINVDILLDSEFAGSCLFLSNARMSYFVRQVRVTQTARNVAALIDHTASDASSLYLVASLFEPVNVEGLIIRGVGGAEAVDDQYWVTSNNLVLPADAP